MISTTAPAIGYSKGQEQLLIEKICPNAGKIIKAGTLRRDWSPIAHLCRACTTIIRPCRSQLL
jgi:hypothetical protein